VSNVRYSHTQPGHLIRLAGSAAVAATLAAILWAPPEGKAGPWADVLLGAVAAIVALATGLFWSMTVRVTDTDLEWWFGPGLLRWRVPLEAIEAVEPARTTIWHGWGVHWTRRGWLYNISGLRAVLVRRKNGRSLLLGTDEPEALIGALREAIARAATRPTAPGARPSPSAEV